MSHASDNDKNHPADADLRFDTRAIHGGQHPDPLTGAVMPPIYATSTYRQQSPGVHLSMPEKLEIGHALVDLGVDILEGGFPISSPGDFEAVKAVAQKFGDRTTICGLARCLRADIERAKERLTQSLLAAVDRRVVAIDKKNHFG